MKYITTNELETIEIAKDLIKLGNFFIIEGEMGSGKTRIAKGLAKAAGVKEEITSPTFGFKKTYDGFIHYDLFSVEELGDDILTLLSDELEDKNIVVIEWANKLSMKKLSNYVKISINVLENDDREITVEVK